MIVIQSARNGQLLSHGMYGH
eukprot:COSAG05_NODE_18242_length_311_cov_0.952830_1_plen_20_part_01